MDLAEHKRRASQTLGAYCLPGPEMMELCAEVERLRALLLRYQAANYIPEDCDLYAETKAALAGKARSDGVPYSDGGLIESDEAQ